MRDAYHEELDSISDGLVEMTRLVGSAIGRATTALLDADLDAGRERDRRGREGRRRCSDDLETRASTCSPASSRSPPTCASSSPRCG